MCSSNFRYTQKKIVFIEENRFLEFTKYFIDLAAVFD